MISEIQIQDYRVVDTFGDSFLAKVAATCFIKNTPSVIEILVESPWSEIDHYKILIKAIKSITDNQELDIEFDEVEILKKTIAVFFKQKIK